MVTALTCRAPHPLRHLPAFAERDSHGVFVQELPYRMEPVREASGAYRVVESWAEVDYEAGEIGVPCWHDRCGLISIYRVLPPDPAQDLPCDIAADAAA